MEFKTKFLSTSDNLFVDIYDEVFSYQEREYFETEMYNSSYRYDQPGAHTTKHLPWTHLHKRLSVDEINSFGFFKNENVVKILSRYKVEIVTTGWFNLSLQNSINQIHSDIQDAPCNDSNQLTLMYYATNTWQESYGGETFFYNKRLEKEIVVDYIPGRIIIFDSKIPHKPALSLGHTVGRYVFVGILLRNLNESNHTGR